MRGHHVGLDYHRNLLDDPWRVHAYDRAIRALVKPGDVVLDVGTGSGILAMLAARRGARVHAVESAAVAVLAERLVAHNGLADRVTVHHADLVELDVREPVDWVVSEFMGRFVVDDAMQEAIEAAGAWLKPSGRFLPHRVTLHLAPVGDFSVPMVERWQTPLLGLDLSPGLSPALHSAYHAQLGPAQLLAPPQDHAVVVPPRWPAFDSAHRFTFARDGRFMGMAGFFTADLAPGVRLTTAPGVMTHWGQYLFPMEPRPVQAGQTLAFALRFAEDQWHWEGELGGAAFSGDTRGSLAGPVSEHTWRADREEALARSNAGAALHGTDPAAAIDAYEAAVAALGPDADDIAPTVFENLGLAYLQANRPTAAIQALLRGEHGPQAALARQWLHTALQLAGRPLDAARLAPTDPDPER